MLPKVVTVPPAVAAIGFSAMVAPARIPWRPRDALHDYHNVGPDHFRLLRPARLLGSMHRSNVTGDVETHRPAHGACYPDLLGTRYGLTTVSA